MNENQVHITILLNDMYTWDFWHLDSLNNHFQFLFYKELM